MEMLRRTYQLGSRRTSSSCITIGYASTFLAGFPALVFILRGLSGTSSTPLTRPGRRTAMVHGGDWPVLAMLFQALSAPSLGGIWAD